MRLIPDAAEDRSASQPPVLTVTADADVAHPRVTVT
jgi:hypothetical protein